MRKKGKKKGRAGKSKPVKNPSKPRFFERARPNQLWQSDTMTFRLAGRNAYLIGFLDDCQPVDSQQQALEKQLEPAHRDNALLKHKMELKDVLTDLKLAPGMDRAKKK